MRPFVDPGHLWITQLIELFDLVDYPIEGYQLPKITTELHVHVSSCMIAYDHCNVKPESPLKIR
jgi:hypothetical protein